MTDGRPLAVRAAVASAAKTRAGRPEPDRHQASLIQATWSLVEPRGPELAQRFYARLFELDPHLQDLFALAEMDSQGRKFMIMMAEVLRMVQDPAGFEALLVASGRRHRAYGVVDRHYLLVGEALLWALDATLNDGLDDDARQAWAQTYTRMAFLMQKGKE
jgi:hemoglobin-like flavoprotein